MVPVPEPVDWPLFVPEPVVPVPCEFLITELPEVVSESRGTRDINKTARMIAATTAMPHHILLFVLGVNSPIIVVAIKSPFKEFLLY